MADLIYSALCSLDGYVADADGNFDWAAPDEEVHAFVNERERRIGTHLFGRRMYDVLAVWEQDDWLADEPAVLQEYAQVWRAADKVVYSRTLDAPRTERTRIERELDPEAVRTMKAEASADLSIGGAEVAGVALRAGLVDEIQLYLSPVIVGGGNRALPAGARQDLSLVEERRFANGTVFLRYRVAPR